MPKKKPSLDSVTHSPTYSENKIKEPSSPKEAREWLEAAALHLSEWSHASRRFQFVGRALLQYLTGGGKGEQDLCSALCLTTRPRAAKRGQPKTPLETTVSIIEMLTAGHSVKEISKTLNVKESRVKRERAKINRLLGLRQHGAKPDVFSLEDSQALFAKMPRNELIAMLSATISAKDILPE